MNSFEPVALGPTGLDLDTRFGLSSRNTFRNNSRSRILTDMYHFRSCQPAACYSSTRRSKTLAIISSSTTDGYFHVMEEPVSTCVQKFSSYHHTQAAFRDKVIDTSFSVFIASVPVLSGGVLSSAFFPA